MREKFLKRFRNILSKMTTQKINPSDFTRYEIARILGARGLQIAMNAPLMIKITPEDLEKIHYDSLKIAEIEFNSGVLPISVNKPFPAKKEEALKRVVEKKISDEEVEQKESEEEEEIAKEGEIMELANPDDETTEESFSAEDERE